MRNFIFMLTRDDVTISNAASVLEQVLETNTMHIGFKDIGLPLDDMHKLVKRIKSAGRSAHLEVVSLTEEDELNSARVAVELGVDYLIGGTRWQQVSEIISGKNILYYPYVGEIIGHPAKLGGTAEDMLNEAKAMTDVVDGINLLAYRHASEDGLNILKSVVEGTNLPVICAGSIDTLERVTAVNNAGAWGFTVGTAALDGKFEGGTSLTDQINSILSAAELKVAA